MEIQSVIPSTLGLNTIIHALEDKGEQGVRLVSYAYSHAHEMLHDPHKQGEWLDGKQLSLTEAIQFVISL